MKLIKTILAVVILVGLASCTSSHDIYEDGSNRLGGGYGVRKVSNGKFFIIAKTNWAPIEDFRAARSMWSDHAEEACGGPNYDEEKIKEHSYEAAPAVLYVLKYIVTVKEGYAICRVGADPEESLPETNSGS